MAIQTTPHTNTQQNVDSAAMDLEPGIDRTDLGRGPDAALYQNNDGAQTGGNRAFHANDNRDTSPKAEGDTGEVSGFTRERLPQNDQQGITNHPGEERSRQEKLMGNE
jgi:hypothetical protein